jgi:small subunit ribosomal protein S16
MGNTNRPFYRIVVIDSRKRRDGRAIEEVGWYDPVKQPAATHLKEEAILGWLDRGAEPSETVGRLLKNHGLIHKWQLLKQGVSAQDATKRVVEALATKAERPKKSRPSKKARAKAEAATTSAETPADA